VSVPDNKKSWFEHVQHKVREIRATCGTEVTVPRVLGFLVVRLLAEGLRYLVQELWKDVMRLW
jgi:hypothetical protein